MDVEESRWDRMLLIEGSMVGFIGPGLGVVLLLASEPIHDAVGSKD
jgi:hypothetical protein